MTRGYSVTMVWCGNCLPDGMDGLDPMDDAEATGAVCDSCGADLSPDHGNED